MWLCGYVSQFPNFKFSKTQNCQSFKILKFRNLKASKFRSFKFSKCQDSRVPKMKKFKTTKGSRYQSPSNKLHLLKQICTRTFPNVSIFEIIILAKIKTLERGLALFENMELVYFYIKEGSQSPVIGQNAKKRRMPLISRK